LASGDRGSDDGANDTAVALVRYDDCKASVSIHKASIRIHKDKASVSIHKASVSIHKASIRIHKASVSIHKASVSIQIVSIRMVLRVELESFSLLGWSNYPDRVA
jgi:hypothetical protein